MKDEFKAKIDDYVTKFGQLKVLFDKKDDRIRELENSLKTELKENEALVK